MARIETIPTPDRGPAGGYLSRSAYVAVTLTQAGGSLGADIPAFADEDDNIYPAPRGFMVLAAGDTTIRSTLGGTDDVALVGLVANTIYPISVKRFTSSGSSPLTAAQIVLLY